MLNPFVYTGLFHRAVLMSGTALADWALTKNPLKYTIQVAQALNCPLVERDDELAACLRRKRLSEIMAVRVQTPPFVTAFGPVVDGSVVPNEPRLLMGVYKDLFSR
jgi:carboxylesterase type B